MIQTTYRFIKAKSRPSRRGIACLLLGFSVNAGIYANPDNQVSDKIPQQCRINCETQYGVELGKSPAGVPAYSNCNADCVIFEPHRLNDIYTGIKWQCVEYARRWLLHEQGVVFGDVDIAANIWAVQEVTNPLTKQTFEFKSVVNGASALPMRGDLLIYGKDYLGTGHVAVVVAINEKMQTIQVAEQNFANTKWQNEHAREIAYTLHNDRNWLLDEYLIGWKRAAVTQH